MIYNFDYYNRFEEPTLVLCNPDDTEIGIITNFEGLTPNICFSDISEISYRINWVGDFDDLENNEIYEKHIERRQVHVCGVGYFIITGVSEVEDDNFRYKNISAKSCEYELNNINMPYINGTYQLYKAENFPDQKTPAEIASQGDDYMNENCLLYEIMKMIPSWTLKGQIELADTDSVLGKSCRTFESTDVTIYSFLRNELADSYECFVEFDIENREIYLHKYEDFFTELPMVISNENFLNSCEVKTTIDNYVNSLKVEGISTVSISNHNPMGGNTIYNFKHDKDIGLIDGELKEALNYWESKMTNEGDYKGICIYKDEASVFDGKTRIESWINSRNNLSKVKTELIELITECAKNNTVSEIWDYIGIAISEDGIKSINPESKFLIGFGMDFLLGELDGNGDPLTKRTEFIYEIANIIAKANVGSDDESSVNTSAISNLFYDMQFYLSNVLRYGESLDYDESIGSQSEVLVKPEDPNDNYSIISASKELIFAQQLKTRLAAEIENMTKIYNGFEAEREALKTTGIESGYNYYQETEGGEWKYTTPSDATEKLINELNNLVTNLNITEKYLKLSLEEKSRYEDLLGDEDNAEGITTVNLVNNLSDFIRAVQNSNGFKFRFAEYYKEKNGCDDTTATELADRLYTKLTRYLKQQTYTDENIVITESMSLDEKFTQENDLYMHAVSMLNKISEPAYEININAETFMFLPELIDKIRAISGYENVDEVINIKNALNIRLPNGGTPLFHILKITTNYDEQTCELTMGNRLRLSDPASVFSDLQRTATSAANIVASERLDWGINKEKINELMAAKSMDIDTTQRAMTNSVNDVTFGDFGLKCYAKDNSGNPIYGMWMANGTMMFMNENSSPKTAIGRIIKADGSIEYGFNGETVLANSMTADKFRAGSLSKGTNLVKNGSFERSTDFWDGSDAGSKQFAVPIGYSCLYLNRGKSTTQSLNISYMNNGEYILSFYYSGISVNGDPLSEDKLKEINNIEVSLIYETSDGVTKTETCLPEDNRSIQEYSGTDSNNSQIICRWARCYKKVVLPSGIISAYIKITNNRSTATYFDGVMLEKSVDINEYTPHISETYARYTTINDEGVTIYNGKIKILNNGGITVFSADTEGNLKLTGEISSQKGDIAGWKIDNTFIFKEDNGNIMKIASSGNRIFSFKNTEKEVFYVDNDGKLFAEDATIYGYVDAGSGRIGAWSINGNSLNNNNKGELVLENGLYTTKFDGYGIYGGKNNSWGMSITMAPSSGSANGTWNGVINNIFNDSSKTYDNLALAGREEIFFGLRPNGNYKEAGKIYWNEGLFKEFPVFKIEAIQAQYIIINGIKYRLTVAQAQSGGIGSSLLEALFGVSANTTVLGLSVI